MPSSAVVRQGATICASSNGATAEVTADQREVLFDDPQQGAGWSMLTNAEGGNTRFTVSVITNGIAWSNQFKCMVANANQVLMSRPQARRSASGAKR